MKFLKLSAASILLIACLTSVSLAADQDVDDAKVRKWFRRNLPLVLEELELIKSESQEDYEEELENWYELYLEYQEIKEENLEFAAQLLKIEKIDSEARASARKIADMEEGSSKDKQMKKLKSTVTKLFELSLKTQEEETAQLEKEVKELRKLISRRKKLKNKLIEQRLNEMVLEHDEVGDW